MNTIVLGKGYLGREFERQGFEVWGKDCLAVGGHFNPGMLEGLREYDCVVNCIAKTNTKWCEQKENFESAVMINGVLPKMLSDFCNRNAIKFVQISSGCLYDSDCCTEKDKVVAHCQYTLTKWMGEIGCSDNDLILRPRLYYSDVPDKNNLLCKLPKFKEYTNDRLNSFTDTRDIPKAVKALVRCKAEGIYNIASTGERSIYQLAQSLGLSCKSITSENLRKEEGIHLVNSTMRCHKLRKIYEPSKLEISTKHCWNELEEHRCTSQE